ncbi:SHOCT domain-containing protein [Streptomyces sp. NPDC001617]
MFWYNHGVSGWGLVRDVGRHVPLLGRDHRVRCPALPGHGPPGPHRDTGPPRSPGPPEQLLAERFARGEIDEDEYNRRMSVLRAHRGLSPGKS